MAHYTRTTSSIDKITQLISNTARAVRVAASAIRNSFYCTVSIVDCIASHELKREYKETAEAYPAI